MQTSCAQQPADANTLSTVVTWVGAIALAILAAVGLKKTHDIGAKERRVDNMSAKAYTFFQSEEEAAKTRAANVVANLQAGVEKVTSDVVEKTAVAVEAGKQISGAAVEAVQEVVSNYKR